jgi:hypothetical protein
VTPDPSIFVTLLREDGEVIGGGSPSLEPYDGATEYVPRAALDRADAGLRATLVYAARYAMGRYTYAVSETIEAVKAHSTADDRRVLIEDLRSAFAAIERGETQRLGNDQRAWRDLFDWMLAQEADRDG